MERDSGYTARCRPPQGTQFPRAAVGGARTRPGPLGGVEQRGTKAPAGRLAGLGWAQLG